MRRQTKKSNSASAVNAVMNPMKSDMHSKLLEELHPTMGDQLSYVEIRLGGHMRIGKQFNFTLVDSDHERGRLA